MNSKKWGMTKRVFAGLLALVIIMSDVSLSSVSAEETGGADVEVVQEIETTEAIATEMTEATEETEAAEETEVTEEAEVTGETEVTEETEATEDAEVTGETEATEETEVAEETEVTEEAEATEETEVTEETEMTEEVAVAVAAIAIDEPVAIEEIATVAAYLPAEASIQEESETVRVLDMGELSSYVGTTFESKEYAVPGDDYFTFIGEAKLAINENAQTFTDAEGNTVYTSTHRFNPGGGGDTTKRSVKFATNGEATVTVYWISGGNDRQMHILNADGSIHAKTEETSVKNSKYISTMEITAKGTYYLCGNDGSNYIYRIEIEEVPSVVVNELDMGELSSYVGVTFESKEYAVPGDDYFTFIGEAKLAINENAQTFTDAEGNTVYTSTHRFNPGGGGDTTKRSVKFATNGEATVTVYWISGGNDRQMHILNADGSIHAKTEETSVKNSKYISTMEITAKGTYYLCGKDGSNYMYKIVVEEKGGVAKPTVNIVTAQQDVADASGATVQVSFAGTAGGDGSTYIVEASKDEGANWIKVGSVDGSLTEGSVTVDLSKKELGFGSWKFRVRGANEVVTAEAVVYAAKTYVLSGSYNTGLEDATLLTGLTFTATSESIYEVPAVVLDTTAYTYSVALEQGTTYAVNATGVDEYGFITPAGEIVYTADTTLNLEFYKKIFYPITISFGSTPDLTGKNITYTFTHEDGTVYTFEDATAIALRDGAYTVALGGDMNQLAYNIKTGDTLTVSGAAVNHAITFTDKTSWSFAAVPNKIEGTTGWFHGIFVDATNGKLATNGDNCCAAVNSGTILKVPVLGPCTITVTPHSGQAQYALYTINGVAASTTESSTTVEYTGGAGTIDIVATGTAYIAGIAVTYQAKEVEFEEQPVMPSVPETDSDAVTDNDTNNIPKGNNKDSMTVQPLGQKLLLSQAGGKYGEAFSAVSDLGYYLFPMTSDDNKLEFDVIITDSRDTSNSGGFLAGVFTNDHVYSLGLRGGIKVRGLYSKSATGFVGAGSPTEENIGLNRLVHYVITMADTRPTVTITFVDDDGVTQTRSWSQNPVAENGATPEKYYFGFMLANVDATITNMIYTSGDGKTVYYDQNNCYYPAGAAPTANTVNAVAAETREYIDVTWTGSVPEEDGTYVVEMQRDGGEWVELTQDVTGFGYRYLLPAGEGGNYTFRVCGQLGKASLGGTRNAYATMSGSVYVMGALEKPVVDITTDASSITISWDAVDSAEYYKVYRYTYDEGETNAVCVAERFTETVYKDTNVAKEMPYYYCVQAFSDATANQSPVSATVWQVPTEGHTGEYVYEKEATKIAITKKSYDTVFSNKVVLEGVVYGDGKLEAVVNGTSVDSKELNARGTFSFNLTVAEGRNDVNLLFTDKNGNVTRETYNFVYLTNYDMVVDAAYTGVDGTAVNGIPTYKTVQAAVDAVPSGNTERVVILVLAGSYEERLVVDKPNISLVGEDRENTNVHFYPGVLGSNYEAGGDMDKRCAIYIKESATGFSAENITFANDYVYSTKDGKSNKSADAIRVEADQSSFVNVKFEGVQDTLYMHSGKQYYYKCLIKGLVDFIYSGDKARSFFNDCEILYVYESTKTSGYVCAPKTAADATYGLTFYNCVITSEEGCAGTGYLLARPWGANAYITWINCYMGSVINEFAPYGDMSGNMHEDARFYEFGTYGPAYKINVDRRQISPAKADAMISADYLGWNPKNVINAISAENYIGTVTTDRDNFVSEEVTEDSYLWTDGDDTGLKMYDMEGYAESYGVTGGGLLLESNENYYKVSNAAEFLDALIASKKSGKNSVIELTADINLGCKEIENFASYSDVIKAYSAQPLTHPTLLESGVSQLTFNNVYNLTIFSSNASSIKRANITMKNSENIIIRNVKFDELWEWDEATEGDYDRNDWDYMTVDSTCDGIWIDHCTFYKAYDGIIDVKNPNPIANVTISWCEFLPGSENDEFFKVMMDEIFNNPDKYPTYKHMLEEGMTDEQVYMYAYGQKKTHLFGQSDDAVSAAGIQATLANNYYYNSMDRMPRLRYGYSHVYNCIMDSQELLNVRDSIANEEIAKKIVSNGAASTCGAQVLLENCYISGIMNALNSGNGSSPSGYINAINSLYYMNGKATTLEPKCNTTGDTRVLITDAEDFIANLPYEDYVLYNAKDLKGIVPVYAGAGKLQLTTLQWEKVSYNADWKDPIVVTPDDDKPGTDNESESDNQPDSDNQPGSDNKPETDNQPETDNSSGNSNISDFIQNVENELNKKQETVKETISSLLSGLKEFVDSIKVEVGQGETEKADVHVRALVEKLLAGESVGTAVSKETSEKILKAIKAGEAIVSEVVTQPILAGEVVPEEKNLVESTLKELENVTTGVLQYFELSVLLCTENGEVLGTYDELPGTLRFTIKIPENMDATGKTFVVIRVHNGEVAILDTIMNGDNTLTFETDRFSTYALAYKEDFVEDEVSKEADSEKFEDETIVDTEAGADVENTEESDNSMLTIGAIAALLLSVCSLIIVKREKTLNE